MLDVSRHFFTKDEVKHYIDDMVRYKFNTLHLHLSDDQGWRIEIKSLPQLTQHGAWRVARTGAGANISRRLRMNPLPMVDSIPRTTCVRLLNTRQNATSPSFPK